MLYVVHRFVCSEALVHKVGRRWLSVVKHPARKVQPCIADAALSSPLESGLTDCQLHLEDIITQCHNVSNSFLGVREAESP